ncbi:MAG: outer membrane protein transport protein [Verrucomicrobia bacterium]|nr:outer membrane protein transport protein [Verrucomicrobiota bacterium]
MRKYILPIIAITVLVAAPVVQATNGDNLIGVGPVSRSLGGVGVAAPQDSLTAIFGNPAGMSFCPCGEQSEAIFGATLFDPTVNAKITTPMGVLKGTSQHPPFIIPAVGVTTAINEDTRFGFGAYGISGLGVDYRNKGWDLDGNPANGFEGDLYTRLEIMKFAPMLAYQVSDSLAVGGAFNMAYNNLDLGQGGSHDYSYGAQVGLIYSLGSMQVGASYTTPMKASHEDVYDFDGDMTQDTLDLEAPAAYAAGLAVHLTEKLMVELDTKFYEWSAADGYSDFDWDDQWVYAIGAQLEATDKLTLRAGYNYAENPVKSHDGWDPMGGTMVQGKMVPTFGYEMLRTIGFPAVVESHATVGLAYRIADDVLLNLGYMHAFEKDFSNTSAGGFVDLESSLEEDSYSFSLAWEFE